MCGRGDVESEVERCGGPGREAEEGILELVRGEPFLVLLSPVDGEAEREDGAAAIPFHRLPQAPAHGIDPVPGPEPRPASRPTHSHCPINRTGEGPRTSSKVEPAEELSIGAWLGELVREDPVALVVEGVAGALGDAELLDADLGVGLEGAVAGVGVAEGGGVEGVVEGAEEEALRVLGAVGEVEEAQRPPAALHHHRHRARIHHTENSRRYQGQS